MCLMVVSIFPVLGTGGWLAIILMEKAAGVLNPLCGPSFWRRKLLQLFGPEEEPEEEPNLFQELFEK